MQAWLFFHHIMSHVINFVGAHALSLSKYIHITLLWLSKIGKNRIIHQTQLPLYFHKGWVVQLLRKLLSLNLVYLRPLVPLTTYHASLPILIMKCFILVTSEKSCINPFICIVHVNGNFRCPMKQSLNSSSLFWHLFATNLLNSIWLSFYLWTWLYF